jgi:hypothetical protein
LCCSKNGRIYDESSSITPADFYASLQTMADIVNKFTIGEDNVRVALVAFNELARTVFNFNTSFVKSEINSTILGTTQSSGSWKKVPSNQSIIYPIKFNH